MQVSSMGQLTMDTYLTHATTEAVHESKRIAEPTGEWLPCSVDWNYDAHNMLTSHLLIRTPTLGQS